MDLMPNELANMPCPESRCAVPLGAGGLNAKANGHLKIHAI